MLNTRHLPMSRLVWGVALGAVLMGAVSPLAQALPSTSVVPEVASQELNLADKLASSVQAQGAQVAQVYRSRYGKRAYTQRRSVRYTQPRITRRKTQSIRVRRAPQIKNHNGQYGRATYKAPAWQTPSHNGQYGGVTYFGKKPVSTPTHNGQYGGVTYLNGARPYQVGGSGSHGGVTIISPNGSRPTVNGRYGSHGGYSTIRYR